MQQAGQVPDGVERAVGDVPGSLQGLERRASFLEWALRHGELHLDGRQRLTHLIVQLTGNGVALILLHFHQATGQELKTLAVPVDRLLRLFAIGDVDGHDHHLHVRHLDRRCIDTRPFNLAVRLDDAGFNVVDRLVFSDGPPAGKLFRWHGHAIGANVAPGFEGALEQVLLRHAEDLGQRRVHIHDPAFLAQERNAHRQDLEQRAQFFFIYAQRLLGLSLFGVVANRDHDIPARIVVDGWEHDVDREFTFILPPPEQVQAQTHNMPGPLVGICIPVL